MEGGRLTIKNKIVRMPRFCAGEENQQDSANQRVASA